MKKKLLFTGASGFLGYHLLRVFANDWDIYGITNSKDFDFAGATRIKCDLTNYIELGNYFDDIEPDAVIHAAAIADANFCQQNKELAYSVNVDASKNLAGICCDFQIPFAFTSTDLVFDGIKGMYCEEDEKNPLSIYGEQKAIAEDEILSIYPEATVFRLPIMFGYPEASLGNYMRRFIEQIKRDERATLFNDEYRSIAGARSISEGILKLLGKTSGIIHVAGPERLSRYDFGLKVVRAFDFDPGLIEEGSQKAAKNMAPRPADVSLNIKKAIDLGYIALSADTELGQIANGKYF
jgi:dTDP-4-dehydrorhamnose reductase